MKTIPFLLIVICFAYCGPDIGRAGVAFFNPSHPCAARNVCGTGFCRGTNPQRVQDILTYRVRCTCPSYTGYNGTWCHKKKGKPNYLFKSNVMFVGENIARTLSYRPSCEAKIFPRRDRASAINKEFIA